MRKRARGAVARADAEELPVVVGFLLARPRQGRIGIGWAESGGEAAGLISTERYLAADGIENVIKVLEDLEDEKLGELEFVELAACAGGCVGGVLTVTAVGAAFSPITPFSWWKGALLAFAIAIMGFFGGLVMSAIKRDAGVKDYGHLIEGHGGVMDRLDSLAFAAPVFFHVVRWYWPT